MTRTTPFQIRPFRPEDQSPIKALILTGLGEHFGYIDETLNPDLDDIQATYMAAGHDFVVVETAGERIGCGCLVREGTLTGRIVRMSVDGRFRGQGIGRAIVDHLLHLARQRRFSTVLVETNNDWWAAIALYERCGFREYARDEENVYLRLSFNSDRHHAGGRS